MDDQRTGRVEAHGLEVDATLHRFIEEEALPGSGVEPRAFWSGLAALVRDLAPRNRELLAVREEMQACIDEWHRERRGRPHDAAAYRAFLEEIGYLVPEGPDFTVETEDLDPEIATVAGAAARGARDQRALRAQRGQRALGLALRRALRHGRDGLAARGPALRRRARAARHRPRQGGAGRSGAPRGGLAPPARGLRGDGRARARGPDPQRPGLARHRHQDLARGALLGRAAPRAPLDPVPRRLELRRLPGHARGAHRDPAAAPRPPRDREDRPGAPRRRLGPRGRGRRRARGGGHRDRGLRGFGRVRGRARQGGGLPQLAGG